MDPHMVVNSFILSKPYSNFVIKEYGQRGTSHHMAFEVMAS